MAKQDKPLSNYQKGVIRRYYENQADLGHQKLSEMISDLYLETSEKKRDALWGRIEKALVNTGEDEKKVKKLVASRDVEALAKYATESY